MRTFLSTVNTGSEAADVPGKPIMIEVARVAGVSKSTVSRVLLGGAQVKEETKTLAVADDPAVDLGYERNDLASSCATDQFAGDACHRRNITNPTAGGCARPARW